LGNPSSRLLDLNHDGKPECVSGDDRFPYVFTDYADSAWPVRIWSYRGGFRDVTRLFPSAVLHDARRLWRYTGARIRRHDDTYGLLAPGRQISACSGEHAPRFANFARSGARTSCTAALLMSRPGDISATYVASCGGRVSLSTSVVSDPGLDEQPP
jgi:hypothetical protein